MNVTQLINNKGNAVKNQFVITTDKGQYFKSYNSLIAFKPNCGSSIVLTKYWNYSVTTLRHLKTFLCTNDNSKKIREKIDSGEIILNDKLQIE